MRLALAPLLALLASASAAETPVTGAEFETFVTGRTLDFASQTGVYGTGECLPGRRVRWAFSADRCKCGQRFEVDGQICLVYDCQSDRHCRIVRQRGDRLAALNAIDAPGSAPRDVSPAKASPTCEGADVGA
jgi:hypothetical protein